MALVVGATSYPSLANANSDTSNNTFYDESERGWYWYEQLPQKEKEKIREKILAQQPTVIPKKTETPEKETKPLSTAWFRQNFEGYKNKAIDNPYDKEAMRTYLYLEKFMRDRAVAFGYERQKAVYAEPFLDATAQRPTANFGTRSMNKQASAIRDKLLMEIGEKSGIYFFYRSDDQYSELQAPLIKLLERDFGFNIKPVSMDGKPMKNPIGEDFLTDSGQAEALGVMQVPALYIFNPEINSVELIAQGLQSLPDLKKRIIAAAERANLITPERAQMVRGTGLYQTTTGDISNGFPMPDDAPETFKQFYFQSVEQGQ